MSRAPHRQNSTDGLARRLHSAVSRPGVSVFARLRSLARPQLAHGDGGVLESTGTSARSRVVDREGAMLGPALFGRHFALQLLGPVQDKLEPRRVPRLERDEEITLGRDIPIPILVESFE